MRTSARRACAPVAGIIAMLAVVVAMVLAAATSARAEVGDRITSFDIAYVVKPDGSVRVSETISYSFASFARHGIYRDLLVRVPLDDDHDRLYEIEDMSISSPTGASTDFSVTTSRAADGRTTYASYQIGSAERTVDRAETYVLEYTVRGALNAQDGADTEFYWNATGNSWDAAIEQVSVSVEVPGGATQVACWAGPAGSSTPCDAAQIVAGQAQFDQTAPSFGAQWGVTTNVGIEADRVNADKIIVDAPTWLNQNGFTPVPMTLGAVALGALALFGVRLRRESRDKRFAGVPPGVVPDQRRTRIAGMGGGAKIVVDDGSIEPPVAFAPPRDVSPAEASYLRRPGHDPDQLAATILDLAHRGVLRIVGDEKGDSRRLELVARGVLHRPHEQAFVDHLFADGRSVSLSTDVEPGVDPPLYVPNKRLRAALERAVQKRAWFSGPLGGSRRRLRGFGGLLAVGGVGLLGYTALVFVSERSGSGLGIWGAVAAAAGALMLVLARTGRGQGRTATGRAVMDQIEGFEKYLRVAEAHQLRFEEGEDIFSKYLPWAVVFDVAERWSRVCAELSARGAIPEQPVWYLGRWDPLHSYLWISSFNSHVGSAAAAPAPLPNASGPGNSGLSGFSAGSGFSGRGFSGGGGGGGGGGSW